MMMSLVKCCSSRCSRIRLDARSGRRPSGFFFSLWICLCDLSSSLLPRPKSTYRSASGAMTTPTRPSYIIEHMEDLDADPTSPTSFPQWALLEYRQMLKDAGPGSTVHFTGLVNESSKEALRQALSSSSSSSFAEFQVHSEGVLEVAKKNGIDITSICLLDPKSPFPLSIQDAAMHQSTDTTSSDTEAGGPFSHFLFGGILGDDPPRDRTGHLRGMRFPSRHLGGLQMTTDSALNVVKLVVEDGIAMGLPGTETEGPGGTIDWIDNPELHLGQGESVSVQWQRGEERRRADEQCHRSLCPFATSQRRCHRARSGRTCPMACESTSRRTWTEPWNSEVEGRQMRHCTVYIEWAKEAIYAADPHPFSISASLFSSLFIVASSTFCLFVCRSPSSTDLAPAPPNTWVVS